MKLGKSLGALGCALIASTMFRAGRDAMRPATYLSVCAQGGTGCVDNKTH